MTVLKRPRKTGRLSRTLAVILTFLVFLLVFGGMLAWWWINVYAPENRTYQSSADDPSSMDVVFTQEDRRTALIATLDGGEPRAFLLVRGDPQAASVRVVAVPGKTLVDWNGETLPLDSLYCQNDLETARKAFSEQIQLPIDFSIAITYDAVKDVVDYFGSSLEMVFPWDIAYVNEGGVAVSYQAGSVYSLSSRHVRELLDYTQLPQPQVDGAFLQAKLLNALINQHMTDKYAPDKVYADLIGLVTSDIRITHFLEMEKGWQHLSARNTDGTICTATVIEGQLQTDGYVVTARGESIF